jgi:hypothetical protein
MQAPLLYYSWDMHCQLKLPAALQDAAPTPYSRNALVVLLVL